MPTCQIHPLLTFLIQHFPVTGPVIPNHQPHNYPSAASRRSRRCLPLDTAKGAHLPQTIRNADITAIILGVVVATTATIAPERLPEGIIAIQVVLWLRGAVNALRFKGKASVLTVRCTVDELPKMPEKPGSRKWGSCEGLKRSDARACRYICTAGQNIAPNRWREPRNEVSFFAPKRLCIHDTPTGTKPSKTVPTDTGTSIDPINSEAGDTIVASPLCTSEQIRQPTSRDGTEDKILREGPTV
ncbi:hypothetical protein HOY82DRAFT_592291 [Tuber indicum]|nr:hypothetical protein HOY82DRAFT_592291 [Tuber indicum]